MADESINLPPQTLTGKVAIVTGSSRGLGADMALDLARRGAKVCILLRHKHRTPHNPKSKTTQVGLV